MNPDDSTLRPPTPEEPGILPDFSQNPAPSPPPEDNQTQSQPNPLQGKLDELKKQKVEETKAKLKNGIQKLTKRGPVAGPAGAPKIGANQSAVGPKSLPTTVEEGRPWLKQAGQATKRVSELVGQTAKQGLKQTGKLVAEFVAANPEIWIPVAIILVVFIIIAIAIGFYAFSRQSGAVTSVTPTTAVQKSQAGLLAAFAGDKLKQFTIVEDVIQTEETRYTTIAGLMKTNPGGSAITASATDVAQVQTELQQIDKQLKAQDKIGATIALKTVIDQEKKIEAGLPFGTWIANIAKGFTDPTSPYHQDTQVCHIAKVNYADTNNGRSGCGLIVSVALNKAGVPQSVALSTLEIWQNPQLSIVVARPNALDASLAQKSMANLKPGDVVWWGNGSAATYPGALFDHIGIYIGNNQAVNNSSNQQAVRITPLDRVAAHYDNKVFNGAKRYAP